MEDVNQA